MEIVEAMCAQAECAPFLPAFTKNDIKHCIYHGEIIENIVLSDDNISEKSLAGCLILNYRVAANKTKVVYRIIDRQLFLYLKLWYFVKSVNKSRFLKSTLNLVEYPFCF